MQINTSVYTLKECDKRLTLTNDYIQCTTVQINIRKEWYNRITRIKPCTKSSQSRKEQWTWMVLMSGEAGALYPLWWGWPCTGGGGR